MKLILLSVVILAFGGLVLATGSAAVFTDSSPIAANSFTSGTVDIAASPASAVLTLSAMVPGETTSNTLTVQNSGSLELRYAMTMTTTDADGKNLAGNLRIRIAQRNGPTCDFPYYNSDGTTTAMANDNQLFEGILSTAAIGNPSQGNQSGDRVLSAGGTNQLCMGVVLPLAPETACRSQARRRPSTSPPNRRSTTRRNG